LCIFCCIRRRGWCKGRPRLQAMRVRGILESHTWRSLLSLINQVRAQASEPTMRVYLRRLHAGQRYSSPPLPFLPCAASCAAPSPRPSSPHRPLQPPVPGSCRSPAAPAGPRAASRCAALKLRPIGARGDPWQVAHGCRARAALVRGLCDSCVGAMPRLFARRRQRRAMCELLATRAALRARATTRASGFRNESV
jgi:hypothetical protein